MLLSILCLLIRWSGNVLSSLIGEERTIPFGMTSLMTEVACWYRTPSVCFSTEKPTLSSFMPLSITDLAVSQPIIRKCALCLYECLTFSALDHVVSQLLTESTLIWWR